MIMMNDDDDNGDDDGHEAYDQSVSPERGRVSQVITLKSNSDEHS